MDTFETKVKGRVGNTDSNVSLQILIFLLRSAFFPDSYRSLELPDVYYVTATETLLWMLEPSDDLLKEVIDSCDLQDRPKPCSKPKTCELKHVELDGINSLRYLTTCNECPDKYPTIPSLEDREGTS